MTRVDFFPYLPGLLFGLLLFAFLVVTSYVSPPTKGRFFSFGPVPMVVSIVLASVLSALTWSALQWLSAQKSPVEAKALESGSTWRFLVGAVVGLAIATAVVSTSWGRGRHDYRINNKPNPS